MSTFSSHWDRRDASVWVMLGRGVGALIHAPYSTPLCGWCFKVWDQRPLESFKPRGWVPPWLDAPTTPATAAGMDYADQGKGGDLNSHFRIQNLILLVIPRLKYKRTSMDYSLHTSLVCTSFGGIYFMYWVISWFGVLTLFIHFFLLQFWIIPFEFTAEDGMAHSIVLAA